MRGAFVALRGEWGPSRGPREGSGCPLGTGRAVLTIRPRAAFGVPTPVGASITVSRAQLLQGSDDKVRESSLPCSEWSGSGQGRGPVGGALRFYPSPVGTFAQQYMHVVAWALMDRPQ